MGGRNSVGIVNVLDSTVRFKIRPVIQLTLEERLDLKPQHWRKEGCPSPVIDADL